MDNPPETEDDSQIIRLRLSDLTLHNPSEWGGCWLDDHLYASFSSMIPGPENSSPSRKGTHWDLILQTLFTCRLRSPGSEFMVLPGFEYLEDFFSQYDRLDSYIHLKVWDV